jgi:hypothetical protein
MFRQRSHRHRLVNENRQLRAWIERLTLERDAARIALTQPRAGEGYGYLFVVTYGRSGSTLLMGLLNSLPGYCIRGENQGILYDLFQYHTKAIEAGRKHGLQTEPLTPRHPWYGIDQYPVEVAAARMRQLVIDTLLRPEPGTRVTGFKEIRWWMPKPVEYLNFIQTLFPEARFILNTRNLDDVARSSWYINKPNAREDLEGVEQRIKDAVARRGDRSYHIHYDDYVRDSSVLRGLYEWLGEDYDPAQVADVMATRHSSSRDWRTLQPVKDRVG